MSTGRTEIRVLGKLEILADGKPVREPRAKKARLLLGYLILRAGLPAPRANIAALLWPDSLDGVARFNLRQLLPALRRDLGPIGWRLASVGTDDLAFTVTDCWIDAFEFERSLKSNPGEAVGLYRGPLLDGLDADWLDEERAKRAQSYFDALESLADHSDLESSKQWLTKLVEAAPHRESAQQKLIRRLAESGDVAGATQACLRYEEFLRREMNSGLSIETRRIFDEAIGKNEAAPQPPTERVTAESEPAGGAMPLDSKFYIVRAVDGQFCQAILRHDSTVLVKGARQTGKSSLLARGLDTARIEGCAVASIDFQTMNASDLRGLEPLYLAIAQSIVDQVDLDVDPREGWTEARGPNMNFERFIRRQVLDKVSGHVVLGLDEVDRLFSMPDSGEAFGLFRSWHNRRSFDPRGPWSRLTLAIAYATEASLFITDVNQSPFNVGTRLTIDDFHPEHIDELNQLYGAPLSSEELGLLRALINGHPYLTQRALQEFVAGMTYSQFAQRADLDDGIFGDHLRRILFVLERDVGLQSSLRRFIHDHDPFTEGDFYRLRASGLVNGNGPSDATLRCELYRRYLMRRLV